MHSFFEQMREAARQALPEHTFLRLDRGDALFATDAPRWAPEGPLEVSLTRAGFLAHVDGEVMHLWPGPVWFARLEARYPEPPDGLSASLVRFAGHEIDGESIALFARGARLLGDGTDDRYYEKRLRQRAAVCLRQNRMTDGRLLGGGLYACALLLYLTKEER